MSRALVTGGAGFIGSTLVGLLAERGYEVRVFDDLSSAGAGLLDGTGAEIVQGDVRDLDALVAAAQGCDAMFHLAAGAGVIESVEDPLANFDVNARGTVTALWAAHRAGVPRFVFSSSNAPLGAGAYPASEDKPTAPLSPVRRLQGGGRGVLLRVSRCLRAGRGGGAVLQRLRAAVGSQGQRDSAVHPPDSGR